MEVAMEIFDTYDNDTLAVMFNSNPDIQNEIFNVITSRFNGLVRAKAHKYTLPGCEQQDIHQEGMIGLFDAVTSFTPDRNTTFSTFAFTCISNSIGTFVRDSLRKKNCYLKDYVSLNADEKQYLFVETSLYSNPEKLFLLRETIDESYEAIENTLSEFEKKYFLEYINGYSAKQIIVKYHIHKKSIDNAIQRARKKIIAFVKR